MVGVTPAMGERLRAARERARLAQGELAEALGVTRQWVWHIESGLARNVRAEMLDRWAQRLGWKDHAAFFASEAAEPLTNDVTAVRVRLESEIRAMEAEVYANDAPDGAWKRVGAMPVREAEEDEFYMVPLVARVAAGSGMGGSAYTQVEGYVPVFKKDLRGRDVFAVTVTGDCMEPKLSAGDTVLCVKVTRPEQVQSGSLCVFSLRDEGDGEKDGGNVKYVEWASAVAKLRAEDGTVVVVPRHGLRVEGRVWRIIKELE